MIETPSRQRSGGRIRRILERLDAAVFGKLKVYYALEIESEVAGCRSLLDVGCGAASPIRSFRRRPAYAVGVDVHEPALAASRAAGIHDEYRCFDLLALPRHVAPRSFDVVLAADLIEHFDKTEAHALLRAMESVARRKVIVVTPNGLVGQHARDDNPYQEHRSGWTAEELRRLGYRVEGATGWKFGRGELAGVRWRPRFLWNRAALLSRPVVRRWPRLAFHLFAVKELGAQPDSSPMVR